MGNERVQRAMRNVIKAGIVALVVCLLAPVAAGPFEDGADAAKRCGQRNRGAGLTFLSICLYFACRTTDSGAGNHVLSTTLPIGEIYSQRARSAAPGGVLAGRVGLCAIGVPPATPSVRQSPSKRGAPLAFITAGSWGLGRGQVEVIGGGGPIGVPPPPPPRTPPALITRGARGCLLSGDFFASCRI